MKSIMKNIARKIEEHKIFCLAIAFVLTLALRFAVKHNTFGDLVNFYESGQIAASGRNIYVYQTAYNYGFIFAEVLGVLYRAASFFPDDFAAFRTLMIIMLTPC